VEVAEVWLSLDGGRLVSHTPDGVLVPSAVAALRDHMAEIAAREAAERERDAEKERADVEHAAREAAEQRSRELEAELAKLRGTNT
jgi:F0F1-type ATP synthase epsilon subunit